jgi:hypothetical protein
MTQTAKPDDARSDAGAWISFVLLLITTVITCNRFIAIKHSTTNVFAEMTVTPVVHLFVDWLDVQ